MSFIIFWLSEMFSPLGMFIGGLVGSFSAVIGLAYVYIFPETNPDVFAAKHIAEFLAAQPILGLFFGCILAVSISALIIGYLRGGLESPIA